MANNYRQFCFGMVLNSKEGTEWLKEELRKAAETEDPESGGTMHDFEATFYDDGVSRIIFQDNGENGNVEQIAVIVQEYLTRFNPTGYLVMEWADTCSKHRAGEFGGGTAIVTSKKTLWLDTAAWIQSKTRGLKDSSHQ